MDKIKRKKAHTQPMEQNGMEMLIPKKKDQAQMQLTMRMKRKMLSIPVS